MGDDNIDGGRPREPIIVNDAFAVSPVKTAYQQVADQLTDMIISGVLTPGDRLPVESELTELFGVSRSTVREALRALSSKQLITTSRGVGGGSFVVEPSPTQISDELEAKIGLLTGVNLVPVDHLLEARTMLEVPAAGFAASRRSEDHLRQLKATSNLRASQSRPQTNMHFHRVILDAAGNEILKLMTVPLFQVIRRRFLREAAPESFWDRVQDEHIRITEAIIEQDVKGAESLMHEHLAHLRETYLSIQPIAEEQRPSSTAEPD